MKNIQLRIPQVLYEKMLEDLRRPHHFAYERVGFLSTKSLSLLDNTLLIIATAYKPVEDADYIDDSTVGAKINSNAIRKTMQDILDNGGGTFHVHLHEHDGIPSPSLTDLESLPELIDSFSNVTPEQAHGILILSNDSFYVDIKLKRHKKLYHANAISVIGHPFLFQYTDFKLKKSLVFDRQSFLGKNSQFLFEKIKVGIIGYGGGGSHIGQQLAHIGVKNITIFDDDKVETTNLNRLIGSVFSDVKKAILKTKVASRIIKKILPKSKVTAVNKKWQQEPDLLQNCDVVFGCVDSYSERQQLEAECRRFLIPLIDIGMDVHKSDEGNSMSGQIILSMPGDSCMNCYAFLTEDKLAKEAEKYGNVGGRPQVVWPNGVLASTAIGVFVDLITGWTKTKNKKVYLSYDGNLGILKEHPRLKYAGEYCEHYPLKQTGPHHYVRI